jgi:hypothetical protein
VRVGDVDEAFSAGLQARQLARQRPCRRHCTGIEASGEVGQPAVRLVMHVGPPQRECAPESGRYRLCSSATVSSYRRDLSQWPSRTPPDWRPPAVGTHRPRCGGIRSRCPANCTVRGTYNMSSSSQLLSRHHARVGARTARSFELHTTPDLQVSQLARRCKHWALTESESPTTWHVHSLCVD